jgi:hypothetical protein
VELGKKIAEIAVNDSFIEQMRWSRHIHDMICVQDYDGTRAWPSMANVG